MVNTKKRNTRKYFHYQKEILDTISEPASFINRNYNYVFVNGAFNRFYNISTSEIIGNTSSIIWGNEDFENIIKPNMDKCMFGEALSFQHEGTLPNGTFKIIELNYYPHYSTKGKINGLIATTNDITEQKLAERALKKSEALLKRTEKIANVGSWEWDIVSDKVTWSDELFRIFQLNPLEDAPSFVNQSGLFTANSLKALNAAIKKAIKNGSPYELELDIIKKDGEIRHCIARGFAEKNKLEKVVKLYGSLQDITKRKKAEEEIKDNESRLKELNTTKDKLFSIIGHDLKGPVNNILGFSQLIEEEFGKYSEEEIQRFNNLIFQSAQSLSSLLENLLTWSRSQREIINVLPENILVFTIVEKCFYLLKQNALQKQINIINNVPPDTCVYADEEMISTVFRNLISNAIKFTNVGGKVTVSAKQNSHSVIFSVCDNGIGVPAEKLPKLFKPDETTSRIGTAGEKGTGLGLVICRDFVEKNNGEIWVESEQGKGSTFNFTLPVYNSKVQD